MIVLQVKAREMIKRKVLSFILEKGVLYIYYVMFIGLNNLLTSISQAIMFQHM